MAILSGLGRPVFVTQGLAQEKMIPAGLMEFAISGASNKAVSRKYVDGLLTTAGSAITERTYTMECGIEAINWFMLQFALGEFAGITTTYDMPELRYGTVAAGKIADADISTTNVMCTIEEGGSYGTPGPLTRTTGTPAGKQFKVDTTAKELLFPTTLNGITVSYRLIKTITNVESLGVESTFDALSTFSFEGVLHADETKSTRTKLIIDKMTRAGEPSIAIATPTKFSVQFDLVALAGARRPFKCFNLDSAA